MLTFTLHTFTLHSMFLNKCLNDNPNWLNISRYKECLFFVPNDIVKIDVMAPWVTTSPTADGHWTRKIIKYKLYLAPNFISILHHSST